MTTLDYSNLSELLDQGVNLGGHVMAEDLVIISALERGILPVIGGLAGYAGVGKDTAAEVFREAGWRLDSFAHTLKSMALALNPWIRWNILRGTSGLEQGAQFTRLSDLVDQLGWERAKKIAEVREFIQRLGTEGAREHLGQGIWIDVVRKRWEEHRHAKTVLTDVRFPNEARWIMAQAAFHAPKPFLVWINRPGYGPVNGHSSDAGLVRALCTVEIDNDGSVEELKQKVREAILA